MFKTELWIWIGIKKEEKLILETVVALGRKTVT